MRQRSEVTGSADTAAAGHPGHDVTTVEFQQQTKSAFRNSGLADPQRMNFGLEHDLGDFARHRVTDTTGV